MGIYWMAGIGHLSALYTVVNAQWLFIHFDIDI